MTFTYDPGLATDRDRVRFLIGDTVAPAIVQDEEITGILTMQSGVYSSAAAICRSLAARYSRLADIARDDVRKSQSQIAKAFADRARDLETQASSVVGGTLIPVPYAGGISISDKDAQLDDTDRVVPIFTRDGDDFPGIPAWDSE